MDLAKFRRNKNYTQAELARLLGVTRSAVSMWELNLSKPNIDYLKKLANILECTVDDLVKDYNEKEKEK